MYTVYITTDGDFSLPLSDNLVKFGTHGYLLVTDDVHQSIYDLYSTADIFCAYLDNPDDYIEWGNYSITVDYINGTQADIINAAKLLSPIIKD